MPGMVDENEILIKSGRYERLVMQWLNPYVVKVNLYMNNSIEKLENIPEKLYISNYYSNPLNPVIQIIYCIVKTVHGKSKMVGITDRLVNTIFYKMYT
jgi:hypothetical protein